MRIRCECPLWEPCSCGQEYDVEFSQGVTRAALRAVDDDMG